MKLLRETDRLLEDMIAQQRRKVLAIAQAILPSVTPEDVLNPDGYPELAADGPFNYEDGVLAGLLAAQMAIRADARSPTGNVPV
ncbi:MAG: hypothetical protein ACYDCL_12865 [Myxococcales bacterium]